MEKYYNGYCFLINMDRSVDRLQKSVANIKAAGFKNIKRYKAIDGMNDDLQKEWTKHDMKIEFDPNDMNYMKYFVGAQGCILSHMNVWKYIIQNKIPFATVFEDDVYFHERWADLSEEYMKMTPDDFEILYIGSEIDSQKILLKVLTTPAWRTHAYIITYEGAIKYYNLIKSYEKSIRSLDGMLINTMSGYLHLCACGKNKKQEPFIWYVWNNQTTPDSRISHIQELKLLNSGLVFQDFTLGTDILTEELRKKFEAQLDMEKLMKRY